MTAAFKAVVDRDAFLKGLGHVQRVVARKTNIPILANVLIRAEKSWLSLKATDLDIEVAESLPAETKAGAAVTVSAHTLFDIVRKLPDGSQVSLEAKGDGPGIAIKAGRSRFTLQTLPEADFPDLSAGDLPHTFDIPATDLGRLIEKVQFAISSEETRYYLNGIYLHVEDGKLRGVATDGHRLACCDVALPDGADFKGVIVPRKTVGEIARLIDGVSGDVGVELSESKIRLVAGDIVLTSKLIDGQFPDYRRVIPQANDKVLEIDRAEFQAAVDRVSTVQSQKGRAVKLALSKGRVELSVTDPESGTAVEELEAEFGGENLEIGFNSRYLFDCLGQVDGDTTVIRLDQPGSPTIIQGKQDDGYLSVLMPMRV